MLYKCIHIVCDLWNCLFFTQHNAFEIYSNCCMYQQFISSYCCGVFPDIDTLSLCNHLPIIGYFGYYKQNLYEHSGSYRFCVEKWQSFNFFVTMSRSVITGPYVKYIFSCQTINLFSRPAVQFYSLSERHKRSHLSACSIWCCRYCFFS